MIEMGGLRRGEWAMVATVSHAQEPAPAQEEIQETSGLCKTDHGERTNRKLRDQPFYQRDRKGKMRGF